MNSIFGTSYSVPENPPRLEDNLFGVFTQRGKVILILNNSDYSLLNVHKYHGHNSDEKYIHQYSHFSRLLFDVLAIVASPLGSLYKTALDTMKPKLKSNLPPLEHHENVAVWMHLIRPGIFHSPNPDAMCAESHIVLLAKLAANQPYPAWSLIVQLLLVTFNAICPSNQIYIYYPLLIMNSEFIICGTFHFYYFSAMI